MRKHTRRNNYDHERAGAAAVRRYQARQPRQPLPTPEQQAMLEKYAKACGAPALTPSEYATLAQHPLINERKRAEFTELAASVNW